MSDDMGGGDSHGLSFEQASDIEGRLMIVLVGCLSVLTGLYLSQYFAGLLRQIVAAIILPVLLFCAILLFFLWVKVLTGAISKDDSLEEQAKEAYSKGQIDEKELEGVIEVLEGDNGN